MPATGGTAPAPAPQPQPQSEAPKASTDPFAAARERCLQRTNAYRSQVGAPPVTRRSDQEACADTQAQADAANSQPHGAFGKCGETSQNECPGWKGDVDAVLESCLKAMFDEGPGTGPAHGHYNNIVNPSSRSVACGFYKAPDGNVWIVQNFYR